VVWFLLLILIAVVFGFLGALIKGLLWLLVIGCVVFVVALLFAGWRLRSASANRARR
jgi:membrane protein implicated in regulation of membrane protease activity